MKIIDAKTTITVILTLLVLTGAFVLQKSYALPENVPSIVSFKRSSVEDNALKVEVKSNNTGSDFSLEILNITKGTRVNVAGSTTAYTFQNLINGKEYEVMVRACSLSDNKYKCTDYSPGVRAIAGEKDPTPEVKTPVLSSLTPSANSVRLNYTTSGNVTGVEIVNETNKKTYKTTNKSTFTETGLKAGTTYKYKIRVYYILNNQTYPSSYTGVKSATTSASKINISSATISNVSSKYKYLAKAVSPTPNVVYNNKTLKNDTDYTVSYSNNKHPGTATLKVTGKGNYTGSKTKTYKIYIGDTTSTKAYSHKGTGYKSRVKLSGRVYNLYGQSGYYFSSWNWGGGKVRSTGCGPRSVATIMSGYGYSKHPGTVAKEITKNTSKIGIKKSQVRVAKSLNYYYKSHGFKTKHHKNSDSYNKAYKEMKSALEKGHQITIWVGKGGKASAYKNFTRNQHFISVLSIDSSKNKVFVSAARNGNKWYKLSTVIQARNPNKYWLEVWK